MKKIKTLKDALDITNQLINDIIFMCETRTKSTYFTRAGKMGFKSIILFILNFIKKSIQIELDSFFKNIKGEESSITKQGYSEARQKISPIAFVKMANGIISWYYEDNDFKTYKGYRLSAIDGTILELNNSERLRKSFGYANNQSVNVARALASGIYDIENDMMMTSKITKYTTSERELAVELIEQLKSIGLKNDLILFDRGYPSSKLIGYLEKNGIKYLMRVSSSFFKSVNEARGKDQIVEEKIDGEIIKLRVIRFPLDCGEEEILVTNLLDNNLETRDFKALYFKRWGIEVKYNELKNRLQIENFTGDTPIAVEQDFYAAIYLTNMVAIAKAEANQKIEKKNQGKNFKHEYKVNTNILIGKLKDTLVLALLENKPRKRSKMLSNIMKEISRSIIPIRPGRNKPRYKGVKSNKYSINRKKCL
jgi:hypothetical protein